MPLSKLYPIYSFQTSAFYTDEETALDDRLRALRKLYTDSMDCTTADDKKMMRQEIRCAKELLKQKLKENVGLCREVRKNFMIDKNVVCIFDSDLTRSLGMTIDGLNDAIVIVKVFYFEVAESIIKSGFMMNGEKYVFFSASAGQIRTKKFVAVKESLWLRCKDRLTCGLSLDEINTQGGVNTNKYLAYLALCNSATDLWHDFDIDSCIVIDDFETNVDGTVDYITMEDYQIHRQQMKVPITHTDGCGMVLPSVSRKNFMVRAPWIKGLLSPFPFDKFIREANRRDSTVNHGLVKDIYGDTHDILAEDIKIIFTKSQFKLWKYYRNWEDYKERFKRFGCTAGMCNMEEDYIPDAQFNYQMMQTLTDLSDEEIGMIASRTNGKIQSITSDRDTMLRVFGATRYKQNKDPFQECLYLYPELLQDAYCRESLLSIKNKIVKEGRAGRLEINGKYLFIITDLYAACQHWFLGIEEPDGLLRDGEIYCRVYPESEKLDCLRSPHLYREHAVRINMFQDGRERRRWFQTDGVYTSSHDLISKILQFDCDGDRSLVCADPVIINAAERNCKDIVPLYYDMKKAPAHIIDSNEMYLGMENAYKGGSIGPISNDISGIWNSQEPDLDVIKLLCALNNFVIDYAKTLYKPVPPKDVESRIRAATKGKVPHFFVYAKDKEESQVEPINRSVVNRLEYIVKASKLRFNTKSLGHFDYLMLMSEDIREFTQRDLDAIALYYKLARSANMRMANDEENDKDNYYFIFEKIRAQLLEVLPDENRLVNVLVKQLFELRKAKRKRVFWGCFGSVVLENLRANIDAKTVMCESCGRRFIPSNARHRFCPICAKEHSRMMTKERVRKYRQKQK